MVFFEIKRPMAEEDEMMDKFGGMEEKNYGDDHLQGNSAEIMDDQEMMGGITNPLKDGKFRLPEESGGMDLEFYENLKKEKETSSEAEKIFVDIQMAVDKISAENADEQAHQDELLRKLKLLEKEKGSERTKEILRSVGDKIAFGPEQGKEKIKMLKIFVALTKAF